MRKNFIVAIVLTFMVTALACAQDAPSDERDVSTPDKGLAAAPEQKAAATAETASAAALKEKPAEEKAAEEEKIKIEISEREINSRVPSLKNNLKDIIRDADANIKRIDNVLKAEESERGAREHFVKGNSLYKEGKFEEAEKEWNTALGLAKDPEFRKGIRGCLKRAARQIRIAKGKREAEEWAKKKAELRGKGKDEKKPSNSKK